MVFAEWSFYVIGGYTERNTDISLQTIGRLDGITKVLGLLNL